MYHFISEGRQVRYIMKLESHGWEKREKKKKILKVKLKSTQEGDGKQNDIDTRDKKGELQSNKKNIPLQMDSMQAWLLSHSESELQPKSNSFFTFKLIRVGTCDFIYAKPLSNR
jgi:hypothetical protein